MKGMTERSGRVELAPRHAQHSLLLPHVIDQICLGEVNCFTNPESISPIVSPIQNPSEPALNPGLAAEWPEINDPWPDLRDSSHQNSRYTRKSSNHPRSLTFGQHSTHGHEESVGGPLWCGNYCVNGQQDGLDSGELPDVSWIISPMCITLTCHYHCHTVNAHCQTCNLLLRFVSQQNGNCANLVK